MIDTPRMLALLNLVLCLAIIHVCLCRLNCMTERVMLRVRSQYTIYLNCALASALQPTWGEWPQWGTISMAAALLFGLLVSKQHWMAGPPIESYSKGTRDA